MSTQRRRRYATDFKREAVRLQQSSGKSCLQVEKELGIGHGILQRWCREYSADSRYSFRGNGKMRPDESAFRQLQKELVISQIAVIHFAELSIIAFRPF
jgi:transposase